MATIYILEDDLNIQEIEAYALKTADIRQKVLIMPENFLKRCRRECRAFCCWILCFLMRMDWTF